MGKHENTAKVIPITQKATQAARQKALVCEWFERERFRLQVYIKRLLPLEISAEDVIQDIFTRLIAQRDLSDVANPRAYIMTIARNCAIDHLRRNQKIQKLASGHDVSLGYGESGALHYNEMMVAIEKALKEMPIRCREVFIFSRQQGLNTNEIAEKLGVSPRMVQKHLSNALYHFRERLVE